MKYELLTMRVNEIGFKRAKMRIEILFWKIYSTFKTKTWK